MMFKTITKAQASWSPGPATHITPSEFPRTLHKEHRWEGSTPAPAPGPAPAQVGGYPGQAVYSRSKQCPMQFGSKMKNLFFIHPVTRNVCQNPESPKGAGLWFMGPVERTGD